MNRKIIFFLFSLFTATVTYAQFGVNGSYRINQPTHWILMSTSGGNEVNLIGNGPTAGVDYWFRLKNSRVEFLPEINFGQYKATPIEDLTTELNIYSFLFNVHLYPLDFFGDCDCPTFSKGGSAFDKGFFLRFSPGIHYAQQTFEWEGDRREVNETAFSIGGGGGFDLGLSDFITLTPFVELRYYLSMDWKGLSDLDDEVGSMRVKGEDGNLWQYVAGLRLGFRFDYQ